MRISDWSSDVCSSDLDNESWGQFGVDTHAQANFTTVSVAHTALFGIDYRRILGKDNMGNALAGQLDLFSPDYSDLSHVEPNTRVDYSLSQVGAYAQDEMRYHNWVLTLGMREAWAHTNQETGGTDTGKGGT